MIKCFDHIIRRAPPYEQNDFVAFPINSILNWPMATPAGLRTFLNPKLNAQLRAMFDVWSAFLVSPASRYVLTDAHDGWFGPAASADMPRFAETFVCEPDLEYHGFRSWDDFFTRRFRDGVRPVEGPGDDAIVTSACESSTYRIAHNIAYKESFWLKGQPYSLVDMLAHDPLASEFVGGTIYQAFLSARNYHRWHSPVSGTVVKTELVPGTYYAQSPSLGFDTPDGPDISAPTSSQAFLTSSAARALIFINALNPQIGLMCFIAVGMTEVSTCSPTVRPGDVLKKGDELGMFHFGGSTHCLIFRKETHVVFDEEVCGVGRDVRLNAAIARVGASSVVQ
jgi:phosphatidylserine decarboxylase